MSIARVRACPYPRNRHAVGDADGTEDLERADRVEDAHHDVVVKEEQRAVEDRDERGDEDVQHHRLVAGRALLALVPRAVVAVGARRAELAGVAVVAARRATGPAAAFLIRHISYGILAMAY